MTQDVLFITEKYIKDYSFVSDNVDPKQLLPILTSVQDMFIHPLLGTNLYRKLQELIYNDSTSPSTPLPEDYRILLVNYIQTPLLWYTLAEAPIPIQYKLVNKGVIMRGDQTVQVTSTTERKQLEEYCRTRAEWYAQRAINFLAANKDKYPEYAEPGTTCDTIRPDRTQYQSGIYLGPSSENRPKEFRDKYK